jgi:ABC-2 type transport system ATP-binding protein
MLPSLQPDEKGDLYVSHILCSEEKGKATRMAKILLGTVPDWPGAVQGTHPSRNESAHKAIEVHQLVKHYPQAAANAVDGVSFTVQRGEIFGLLGPNGAGKTTTIGILTTRVIPTSGIARIMGIDVATNPVGVKQRISIVPQVRNIDQSLRAREVLTFHASYHGMARAEREARADLLLKDFGLSERANEKVMNYSGGMAQRLILARALMHSPEVLFLDEPTSSLDPQSRLFIWERIRELNSQGVTVLLTTHDMDEAEQLCERIAIMDRGRILVLDTAPELKKLAPVGIRLELQVQIRNLSASENPLSAGTIEQQSEYICGELRKLGGVTKVEAIHSADQEKQPDLRLFHIYARDTTSLLASVIQVILAVGAEICDFHLAHPSLADVFIHLTGRNLRT